MAATGFLHFLNQFSSESSGDFGCYYSFNTPSTFSDFNSDDYSFYATLSGAGAFFANSGSGFFSGNTVMKMSGIGDVVGDGYPLSFFTIVQKSGRGAGIIFSNLSSGQVVNGAVCSGFSFGLNAANRLFFEYYDNYAKKPVMFTYDKILADKNCLAVRVLSNGISLDVYDYFNDASDSTFFNYLEGAPEPSIDFKLGACSSIPWAETGAFKGWIDEFAFSKGYLSDDAFVAFASGAVYNPTLTGNVSGYVYQTGVTGMTTGLIPTFSGVTGQTVTPTGVVTDLFGNRYTGYTTVDLTGIIYQTGFVPLTGLVTIPVFFDGGTVLVADESMADSFSFKNINSLKEISSGDLNSLYAPSDGAFFSKVSGTIPFVQCNQTAPYDRVQGKFSYLSDKSNSGIVFYVNGVFQTTGCLTGDKFNAYDVSGGAYAYSGGKIYSDGFYDLLEQVVIDDLFSNTQQIRFSDFSHISGTGDNLFATFSNFIAFFNGQKLHSGLDYFSNLSGSYFSTAQALFSGETGELQILSGFYGMEERTQFTNPWIRTSGLFPEQSMFFVNGVRQVLNRDYVLAADCDFLTGISSSTGHLSVMFNDASNFFE